MNASFGKKVYFLAKRILDIIVSLCGLIILSPLIAVVALIIKLDSPGPAIFTQKRIGKDNQIFIIHKFRTMKIDTPDIAKTDLLNKGVDPYITRVGTFLRKSLIDEIPQLINVLKGDMSLVGPRPALYNQYDLIKMRTEKGVHKLKPGMTGWAVLEGGEDLELAEKVEADTYYVKSMSFRLDLKIIMLTFTVLFRKKGIY